MKNIEGVVWLLVWIIFSSLLYYAYITKSMDFETVVILFFVELGIIIIGTVKTDKENGR